MAPTTPDQPENLFEPDDGRQSNPIAVVSTRAGVPLRVAAIEDDRTPENMECMGTFFRDRLIARSAVPPEVLEELESRDVFSAPVRLGLAVMEEDPGLQCRLFALLPANQFQESEPDEPWAQSVPRFEDAMAEAEDSEEDTVVPLLLGHIVRFSQDRKHPDDLPAEAVDILQTILADEEGPSEVVDKLLDDLLK
jgi:hypothetical protein